MKTGMLQQAMKKGGISDQRMAKYLKIKSTTFKEKLDGQSDFSVREIQVLKKKLDLTDDEVDSIFFTN